MSDLWIKKYTPTKLKDIVGNNNTILKLNYFVKENSEKLCILISGNHGVGKSMITKIILNDNNYYYKWLNYKDEKSKELFEDLKNSFSGSNIRIFFKDKKKFALVIDDLEKITLKSEKKRIIELVKNNHQKKMFPIIFLSNFQHNKLVTDIMPYTKQFKLFSPTTAEIKLLLMKIVKQENIKLKNDKVINKIITFCQNDIRRLITVLYDINSSFDSEIDYDKIKSFLSSSLKKNKDISLFDASKKLIDDYSSIDKSIDLYNVDKVLVPLTIHENFYKSLLRRTKSNKIILNTLKNVTNSISNGDVIETNIYTDQNWYLHDIHGFFTCAKTSFHINKNIKEDKNLYYNMNFSSDLNQTSLKNINKKQIVNLQNYLSDKSFYDIIMLNKIIYDLVQKQEMNKLSKLVKNYSHESKFIETFIKIDKVLEKITLSQKNKKKFNNFIKVNI